MSASAGEVRVACDERKVERFGEDDEHGIGRGQRGAQLPRAIDQVLMWVAAETESGVVVANLMRTAKAELGCREESTQRVQDLDVDQLRRVKLWRSGHALDQGGVALFDSERGQHGRGVDHRHDV